MVEISIITVVMNHLSFVKEMLRSLYNEGRPAVNFETIIVDNCSKDGSAEFISQNYPDIRLIRNKQPYGFARNNNIGAREAKGRYILILNPDTVLSRGAIDNLLEYAVAHPETGIVAPRLLNVDGSLQYSVRHFPSLYTLVSRMLTRGNDLADNKKVASYLMKDLPHDRPMHIDWCMGACFLISKQLYDELDGFDEKFFLYVEDMDICYRCWQKNRPVVYLPTSVITHTHQRSSMNLNKKTYTHARSFWHFFCKNKFRVKSYANPLREEPLL